MTALDVRSLSTGYGPKQVVFDASFTVNPGEIVTLMGHNGAGKSTILRAVHGLLPVQRGSVSYFGDDISTRSPAQNVADGMGLIPSEEFVYDALSVADNVRLGGIHLPKSERGPRQDFVHELFPIIGERGVQAAGTLSGGQKRMLSLAMLLMAKPRLMMLDEPSLGLAPSIVEDLFDRLRSLADEQGIAVLLVEQNVTQALRVADRAYAIRAGRIFLEESAETLRERDEFWDLF